MNKLRVVFMGTPEFAVASLAALHEAPFVELVGVVTAPDKPAGRGHQLTPSPVKEYAVEKGLPVLQPTNLKSPAFLEELTALKPDVAFVVAFRMLPEVVWALPKMGSINLHGSLLPDYRGAAPIHWAVINGEKRSGVTTFFIRHEIDTGDIIAQREVAIPETMTTGELYAQLMAVGAELVVATARQLLDGNVPSRPQDAAAARNAAPKLSKETARIDWNQPVDTLFNFVRGMSPFPCAWTLWEGKVLKVYFASKVTTDIPPGIPGELKTVGKELWVAAANGWLRLASVQLEGRKRISDTELLAGLRQLPATME